MFNKIIDGTTIENLSSRAIAIARSAESQPNHILHQRDGSHVCVDYNDDVTPHNIGAYSEDEKGDLMQLWLLTFNEGGNEVVSALLSGVEVGPDTAMEATSSVFDLINQAEVTA